MARSWCYEWNSSGWVVECCHLNELEEYMSMIRGELASRLNLLEVSALRSMAAKVRR